MRKDYIRLIIQHTTLTLTLYQGYGSALFYLLDPDPVGTVPLKNLKSKVGNFLPMLLKVY